MAPEPALSNSSQGLATEGSHNLLNVLAICYICPSSTTGNRSSLEMEMLQPCLSSLLTLAVPLLTLCAGWD